MLIKRGERIGRAGSGHLHSATPGSAPPPEWQTAMTEIQFQNQVTQLAEMLGWDWVHFRPGQTPHGWRTPSQGTMARGWPDLFMVRVRHGIRQTMVVELKAEGKKPSDDQIRVLARLEAAGFDVRVWEPKDWPHIEAALASDSHVVQR